MKDKIKAVALFSGGLDSILAVKLIEEQGIKVKGVNFKTPFFGPDKTFLAAKSLDMDLEIIDITQELLEILRNPKHGLGKNMNPCIDCHTLMIKKAGEYMAKIGASFILSGEVLGERPMSQNRNSLSIIERLRDLFTQGVFSLEDIELLKLGRHFRLSTNVKLVVGRNKEENEKIKEFSQEGDFLFKAKNLKGPVSLLKGVCQVNDGFIDKSCQITARYCDRNE